MAEYPRTEESQKRGNHFRRQTEDSHEIFRQKSQPSYRDPKAKNPSLPQPPLSLRNVCFSVTYRLLADLLWTVSGPHTSDPTRYINPREHNIHWARGMFPPVSLCQGIPVRVPGWGTASRILCMIRRESLKHLGFSVLLETSFGL